MSDDRYIRNSELSKDKDLQDSFNLKNQDGYYHYVPQPEAAAASQRSTGLVITAVLLVLIFVFSFISMLFLLNQRISKAEKSYKDNIAIWREEDKTSTDETSKENSKVTEFVAEETQVQKDYRQPAFSLEEATRTECNGEQSMTIAQIASDSMPSVVAISTEASVVDLFGELHEAAFAGSGFIISEDGLIATNAHVLKDAKKILVKLEDGVVYVAELVAEDKTTDLAVIKLQDYPEDKPSLKPVRLGDSEQLQVGELSVAIGNPTGQLEGTVTAGIISALNRNISIKGLDLPMIQTSAAVNSGNSGGALFNSFGEVIGVITGKISSRGQGPSYEGLGFAIPINTAKPVLEDLIRYGYVRGRVSLGIYAEAVSKEVAEHYSIADKAGVLIIDIAPDSAAEKAGLKKGDLIVTMDGVAVTTVDEINSYKLSLKPGDKLRLEYFRNGQLDEVDMLLEEFVP
ncbi:MAG: trypsin-like peptidase domain-containing protein [Eubacteriales bacterium]|nr:trypsin-like peptidase domain-containing protein [Eubacteriales bacterium]